jgi:hypothetical protein
MKNFLIAAFTLFLLSPMTRTSYASNEQIYIAELLMEDDLQTAKTLISIFKPDGAKLKEVLINGLMARVSPDGKNIVYLELKESEPWAIVLSNSEGKKVKNLELKRPPKHIGYPMPTNLIWSQTEKI